MEILGIDVGGSGIKGAPVDTETGALLAERLRLPTPQPSTPRAISDTVAALVEHFHWDGPIGCTLPTVVKQGVVYSRSGVDAGWATSDGQNLLQARIGRPITLLNDADAAGIAEMRFGAGRGRAGMVIMLTFGTGIGSALFVDGQLIPNTEFGYIEVRGKDGDIFASDSARTAKGLSWERWAKRVNKYIAQIEALFSPDMLIIGGGVSRKHQKFVPLLSTHAPIAVASLLNAAGIVGAALAAHEQPSASAAPAPPAA